MKQQRSHAVYVYMPHELHREAKVYAARNSTSVSSLVQRGLRLAMESQETVPVNPKELR